MQENYAKIGRLRSEDDTEDQWYKSEPFRDLVKETIKRTIHEHDIVFKSQVSNLLRIFVVIFFKIE